MVNAAIVNTWGQPPTYSSIDLPQPTESQVRIKILAAGLHTLVRSRASGTHFSVAKTSPPHYPGADGVGEIIPSGELVYFNNLSAPTGSFAEEIILEKKDTFTLPPGADPDVVAVLANPMMSGWMAMTARAGIIPSSQKSESANSLKVAIIGATGVSGHAAVQVARALGATDVVAIGKPGPKLEKTRTLGATNVIELKSGNDSGDETNWSVAADVDIVLDYLWGTVAEAAIMGIIMKRKEKSRRLTWVHIGALAGLDAKINATLLRKANVVFMGCGPGSWTFGELYEQLPVMLEAMVGGGFRAEFAVKGLRDIETWWEEDAGVRILVKP